MRVDLHLHSSFSDGTLAPDEVIKNAKNVGLELIALSDHDSVKNKDAINNINTDVKMISAIELTTSLTNVGDKFLPIHILGYGIDKNNKMLIDYLNRVETNRAAYIKAFHEMSKSVLKEDSPRSIPPRRGSMIQDASMCEFLIKNTKPKMEKEAQKVIDVFQPFWDEVFGSYQEAISVIHAAGGIAVWAHPFVCYKDKKKIILNREEVSLLLMKLLRSGIDGVETYYLSFDKEKIEFLNHLAGAYGLLESAGSDYHGYPGRDNFHNIDSLYIDPLLDRLL